MIVVSVLSTLGLLMGVAMASGNSVSLGEVQGVQLRTATTVERILAGFKLGDLRVVGSQVVYSRTVGTVSEAAVLRDGVTTLSAVMEDGRFTSGSLLFGDKSIDLTGKTVEEVGTMTHGEGFWPCLNNCLASQGINWAIVAVLSILCGLACATVVLCIECIAAVAGATSGTIGYCVNHCW